MTERFITEKFKNLKNNIKLMNLKIQKIYKKINSNLSMILINKNYKITLKNHKAIQKVRII